MKTKIGLTVLQVVASVIFAISLLAFPGTANAQSGAGQPDGIASKLGLQLAQIYQQKQALTPAQRKIDSHILQVVQTAKQTLAAGKAPNFQSMSTSMLKVNSAGSIQVKLTVTGQAPDQLQQLKDLGMTIGTTLFQYGIVEGTVPYSQVEAIAALSFVLNVATPGYAVHNTGAVTSAGDSVLKAADARAAFGTDGTGIKVGVMSDGVDHLASSVSSGDLPSSPAVDVRKASSGDEGTAMLEIVHDLAPGSPLAFYGPTSSTDMVTGISNLATAGCKIIVDDITFSDEPKFEDGPIAQAARQFYNNGGVYVTSAGNDGQWHYMATYLRTAAPSNPWGYVYAHNYGNGNYANTFTIPSGGTVTSFLQWNDQWGHASDDFDFFLVRSDGYILDAGTGTQNGSQNPSEYVTWTNSGGTSVTAYIAILEWQLVSAPSSLILDYSVWNDFMIQLQYSTPANSVRGHAAVAEVLSAAAADASSPSSIEVYSSRGPATICFPTPQTRQVPNITGVDGVHTETGALGYFYDPFYGTSASAPHIAAIAALVWSKNPSLTSSGVFSAITGHAVDLGAAGYDYVWGYGRADAYQAVQSVLTPPSVTTNDATCVTSYSAQLNGTLGSRGTASSVGLSFLWGTAQPPTTPTTTNSTSTAGPFSANITGLSANTTYYFRVQAAGDGTTLGDTKSFTTLAGPTMEPIAEPQGHYYNITPKLTNFGFDDPGGLASGSYKIDSAGWTSLFANPGTSWDCDNWTVPGFGGLVDGSHTIYFAATNNASQFAQWSWQFFKDTIAPVGPTVPVSNSHTVSVWSNDNTVDVTWTAATDNNSGLGGYSILWDASSGTDPPTTTSTNNVTTSATSPPLPDGNNNYFHIKAVDGAGNWGSPVQLGPFFIDTAPPTGPANVASTSHSSSTWSSNSTVTVNWTASTDNLSGLAGYAVAWDKSNTTDPSVVNVGPLATSNTTTVSDGNSNYFHIRAKDNAGNWGTTITRGPYWIDTTGPSGPVYQSSTPPVNTWSNNNMITVNWTGATDVGSGLDGYAITWDSSPATNPSIKNMAGNLTSNTSAALADGTYYFHIRPVDVSGNWGSTVNIGPFLIETVPPSAVANLDSTSHQIGVWSNVTSVSVNWTAATDPTSGIDGYSILWDAFPSTVPPTTKTAGNVTSASSPPLADGANYYVHVRAVDRAGNWGQAAHRGPFWIETVPPTGPTDIRSTSHSIATWSNNSTVTANWTAAADATSGLDGYSVIWDTSATTIPAQRNADNTTTSANHTFAQDSTNCYLHIRAKDNAGNWGATVTIGPFYIDVYSPRLTAGSVGPTTGYTNTTFTFSANYSHPLGLAPSSVALSVDGNSPVAMSAIAGQSGNYTAGQLYNASITGLGVGNHSFTFSASDNASPAQSALNAVGSYAGPSVSAVPSPPTGPTGGGGGVGGGGGGGALPGYTSLAPYIGFDGTFNLDATVTSQAGDVWLTIQKGIVAKDASGNKLNMIGIFAIADPPPAAPSDSKMVGPYYELLPEGASFAPPITLVFKFDPKALPSGVRPADLYITRWDGNNWQPLPSVVDEAAGTVSTKTSGFSRYAVLAKLPPPPPPVTQAAPAPARFAVSAIVVDPTTASPGQSVAISVNVNNTGGTSGDYDVTLKINGAVETTKQVSVAAGGSATATFSVTRSTPGSYQVDVNGSAASFVVQATQPAPTVPATLVVPPPVKAGPNAAVIIGVVVGAVALAGIIIGVILSRRKPKP